MKQETERQSRAALGLHEVTTNQKRNRTNQSSLGEKPCKT